MLVACLRLRSGGVHDGPGVLSIADRESVQFVVADLHIGFDALYPTEHVNALKLDLLRDEVPLYLGELVDGEDVTLLVSHEAHRG